jgi:hypothetical protein
MYVQFRLLFAVPCHAEFCKYIEWHNLAFHTTNDMELEALVVHYDDFPQAGTSILEFLQLEVHSAENNNTVPMFDPKTYQDYFLDSERRIVQSAFEYMASRKTWTTLQRYFGNGTISETI